MYDLMHVLFLGDDRVVRQRHGVYKHIVWHHGVLPGTLVVDVPGLRLTKCACNHMTLSINWLLHDNTEFVWKFKIAYLLENYNYNFIFSFCLYYVLIVFVLFNEILYSKAIATYRHSAPLCSTCGQCSQ